MLPRGRGRRCTDANPQRAQFHAPMQRREGRECVPYRSLWSRRMCACHGIEQGHVKETFLAANGTFNSI
jgi:hypothetical protein